MVPAGPPPGVETGSRADRPRPPLPGHDHRLGRIRFPDMAKDGCLSGRPKPGANDMAAHAVVATERGGRNTAALALAVRPPRSLASGGLCL